MADIADRWSALGTEELPFTSHQHGLKGCRCCGCDVTTGWVLEGEFCDERSHRLGLTDSLHDADRNCIEHVFDFDTIRTLSRAPRDIATLLGAFASSEEGR